ncbi:MAG: hypothetical protein AVDCRST_MAG66-318, partial [uncultured Pseudonocardia sp.]
DRRRLIRPHGVGHPPRRAGHPSPAGTGRRRLEHGCAGRPGSRLHGGHRTGRRPGTGVRDGVPRGAAGAGDVRDVRL